MAPLNQKTVLDSEGVAREMNRIAEEILSVDPEAKDLALVGIRTGGVFLARRLEALIENRTGRALFTGVIDISLYRDDWTRAYPKPLVGKTELNFSIDDRRVVLVDDVLFTGRTIRAAMDALIDFGRPARIELAVLVDRGHRELPICPTYTGILVETTRGERVNVFFSDQGHADEVVVEHA